MKKAFIILLIFGIGFCSCKQNESAEILIGTTLLSNQNKSKNKELKSLISDALKGNETALSKLNKFPCGGGAGCYDLGFVISQIIYKVGEEEIITMIGKLGKEEIRGFEGLISVGLEYGDNDNDGEMDNRKIQIEFPRLLNTLNQKENE